MRFSLSALTLSALSLVAAAPYNSTSMSSAANAPSVFVSTTEGNWNSSLTACGSSAGPMNVTSANYPQAMQADQSNSIYWIASYNGDTYSLSHFSTLKSIRVEELTRLDHSPACMTFQGNTVNAEPCNIVWYTLCQNYA